MPFKKYKRQVQPPKAPKSIDCKCRLGCSYNFNLEAHITICKNYWALTDYKRQKDFILINVKANLTKRVKTAAYKKRTMKRFWNTMFFSIKSKFKECQNQDKNTFKDVVDNPIVKKYKLKSCLTKSLKTS